MPKVGTGVDVTLWTVPPPTPSGPHRGTRESVLKRERSSPTVSSGSRGRGGDGYGWNPRDYGPSRRPEEGGFEPTVATVNLGPLDDCHDQDGRFLRHGPTNLYSPTTHHRDGSWGGGEGGVLRPVPDPGATTSVRPSVLYDDSSLSTDSRGPAVP